jgi:hypothetical protein
MRRCKQYPLDSGVSLVFRMSESTTEPGRTWTTDVVERSIKQPVKEAVREALAEHDAVRTTDSDEAETTDTDEESDADTGETDGADTTTSGRPSAPRLLLAAGSLAGVAYAATRWRRRNDSSADAESADSDEAGTTDAETTADEESDADSDDEETHAETDDTAVDEPIRDGERSTAPTEDATAS